MNKTISPKITALTFGILTISFLVAFYVIAWQEPTSAPPGDNVPTPLNVSDTTQIKTGQLSVGSLRIIGGAFLPTCDVSYRGKLFLLQSGTGVEDGLYVCKKKKDGSYAWIALASPANFEAAIRKSLETSDVYVPAEWPNIKRFFQTAQIYNGNLGGLSGADAKCQIEAVNRGYDGTWKALLGDTSTTGLSRINDGIFVRVQPVTCGEGLCYEAVAADKNDLVKNPYGKFDFACCAWAQSITTLEPGSCTAEYSGGCYSCGCCEWGECFGSCVGCFFFNACKDWTYAGTAYENYGCYDDIGVPCNSVARGKMSGLYVNPWGQYRMFAGQRTCGKGCNALGSLVCVEQ